MSETLPPRVRHRGRDVLLKYHRLLTGSGRHAPNGLRALDECLDGGAEVLEIDIRLAADGRFVMLHDATLQRETDDGVGPVARLTSAEFTRLRLRGSDERAATFDQLIERLEAGPHRALKLQIDLKEAAPLTDPAIDVLLEGVDRLAAVPQLRVVVGCLADWNLRALCRRRPDLAVGLDFAFYLDAPVDGIPRLPTRLGAYGYLDDHPLAFDRRWPTATYLEDRFAALVAHVPNAAEYYLRKELLALCLADGFDPIAWLHTACPGCLVDVWTIDPDSEAGEAVLFRALDAGADQITTNQALQIARLLQNH